MGRRARAWLGVVVGAGLLAACVLNPQPEPPDRDYSPGPSSPPSDGEDGVGSMRDAAADAIADAADGSDGADSTPNSDSDAAVDGSDGEVADGDADGSAGPVGS